MVCELLQRYLEKESKDHRVKCAKEQKEAVDRLLAYDINDEYRNRKDQSQDNRKSCYDIQVVCQVSNRGLVENEAGRELE